MPSYQTRFRNLNMPAPSGSRSIAGIYGGSPCPDSLSFGRGHGVSPMNGSINVTGEYYLPYGSKLTMRIGASLFTGVVVNIQNNCNNHDGFTTEIQLVDMRDRLHDYHVYGQFNMIDSDTGMYYHIYPVNWESQVRTIVRKLDKQNFKVLTQEPPRNRFGKIIKIKPKLELNRNKKKKKEKPTKVEGTNQWIDFICEDGLISAASIINELSFAFGFTWSASAIALKILQASRPDNLDWNTGIKVIEGMQQILEKQGLQMTFWGDLHCHITLKGWGDNPIIQKMLTTNACQIPGYVGDSRGGELNERGRRVVVVGDRNRYENYYPATPNWNKKFDLNICLGWGLAAVLEENNLTLRSKLQDMPYEWNDPEKWNDKPRGEMTIEDYINQICFRVYVVDTRFPIRSIIDDYDPLGIVMGGTFKEGHWYTDEDGNDREVLGQVTYPGQQVVTEKKGDKTIRKIEDYAGNEDYRLRMPNNNPFSRDYDSYYPVSASLIEESGRQFIAYSSYANLRVKGAPNPFDLDPETQVPVIDGVSLDIEQTIDPIDCCERYRIRLVFSEMKYILPIETLTEQVDEGSQPEWKIRDNFDFYSPDYISVKLALDKEIFTYAVGEIGDAPRIREQRQTVNGLRRNFHDNKEVSLLTLFMQDRDVNQFVTATDIAEQIGAQALFHENVTFSGGMTLQHESGFQCDGIIDTISVSYNSMEGTQEQLSFTNIINDRDYPIVMDQVFDYKYKDVKLLAAEQLNKQRIDVAKAHKLAKQVGGDAVAKTGEVANPRSWQSKASAFGNENTVAVKLTGSHLTDQEELYPGEGVLAASGQQFGSEVWNAGSASGNTAEDRQTKIPAEQFRIYS